MNYEAWIKKNIPMKKRKQVGKCRECCEIVHANFRELSITYGEYECSITGKMYPHFWLEDTDGKIIDPTRWQFIDKGLGIYHTGYCDKRI